MRIVKGPRRVLSVLLIAVALSLLSAACSGNPDPVADAAPSGIAFNDGADTADSAPNQAADTADTASDDTASTDTASTDTASTDTASTDTAPDDTASTDTASDDVAPNDSGDGDGGNGDAIAAPAVVSEEDLARFVAASEAAVADSSVEGVVLDAPEIYVAIAQASCARFSQGHTLEEIVGDHLDSTPSGSADDEQLIGAVLGAAVETICPEHSDKL